MSNFYRDNPDILFHIKQMDLSRIVELREDGFADRDDYPEAPVDVADAVDNYHRVLDIVGEIAGSFVAPRAREVDAVGARFQDRGGDLRSRDPRGPGPTEKSRTHGIHHARKYGGLNMPKTVYSMAIEMISRADASLMNIFGLQEIADTINKFASEDQKERFLPRFCSR